MLSLHWRLAFWLVALAAMVYGIDWALSLEGATRIGAGGWELEMRTGVALLTLIFLVAAIVFAFWVAMTGLSTIAKGFAFFRKRREQRGLSALSTALIALAEGDGPKALTASKSAEKLLANPDLTRLVSAQAAKLAGDEERAARYYEMMAGDRDTAFLGAAGLLRQALADGRNERALVLAERAHALRPKESEVIDALFDLQKRKGDYAGARETIRDAVKAGRITRDVGDRRRAVLHVSEALAREAEGDEKAAHEQAVAAIRLAPGLAPAAVLAARMMAARGERRGAARALIAAWRLDPHPDVAAAFAALEPEETPAARRKRFERLSAAKPDAVESQLLTAELALAAEDYEGARQALGDLPEAAPTARACALMAAVEQATGAAHETVRAWLAKAAAAPRSARWVCDNCGSVAEAWSHSCPRCGAFDSFAWKRVDGPEGLAESALFPLLAGAGAAGLTQSGPAPLSGGAAEPALGPASEDDAESDAAEPAAAEEPAPKAPSSEAAAAAAAKAAEPPENAAAPKPAQGSSLVLRGAAASGGATKAARNGAAGAAPLD